MKISEIMQTIISSTTEDASLKEVGRDIFSLGISAIPVVRGSKLIGIVTQKDILAKIYPSIAELTEDYIHLRDFDQMEKRLREVLDSPVSEIMNKNLTTITPETPIMNAQSFMLINDFSHLPVVDKRNNLLGMVSQGDIFRRLIKDEVPRLEKEKYADFVKEHSGSMVDWGERLKKEIPAITDLFDHENVKSVLEFGVWTGEFTMELAKLGKYKILGLDHNPVMIDYCNEKKKGLSEKARNKLKFLLTDYNNFSSIDAKFDSAICVGNGLAFIPGSPSNALSKISKLLKKDALVVLQVLNFEKALKNQGRLIRFRVSNKRGVGESLYMEFFERKNNHSLMYNLVLFGNDGKNWLFKGITSMEVSYLDTEVLRNAFKKAGFKEIGFYGGMGEYKGDSYRLDFDKKFDKEEDDWIIAVARK